MFVVLITVALSYVDGTVVCRWHNRVVDTVEC